MRKNSVDRRVQRTRQLLRDSLLELITEKEYSGITVQNIIDRANLGRSTFYAHYQGKDDLLFSGMEEVVHGLLWGEASDPAAGDGEGSGGRILSTRRIFQHAQEEYQLHKALVAGRGMEAVMKTIHTHLCGHIEERLAHFVAEDRPPAVPLPVTATYLAGTLLTLLRWWLAQEMPYSPEEMDDMFQTLAFPGVWNGLGVSG